ncbi:hypothetical protein FOA52_006342 [Chlamydomonas sp. UWO 241]|nr:hypothetical protein FOA52_006342 [Chlamydomonas sp. UWO 241]
MASRGGVLAAQTLLRCATRSYLSITPMSMSGQLPASCSSSSLVCSSLGRMQRVMGHGAFRSFASAPEQRSGGKSGSGASPMSTKALIIGLMAGAGVLAGTQAFTDTKMKKVTAASQETVGKAAVGGVFELTGVDGKPFSSEQLLGEFALIYFGFTFCPDICPDELEKIALMTDGVEKKTGVKIQPVFISVDPERDTPPKVKAYCAEFHPRLLGLTGTIESVKKVSKLYRVYFSKTGDSGDDYLVDHSIIHYLIDPEGEFVTFYSKAYTADQLTESVVGHMADWKAAHPGEYHPEIKEIAKPEGPQLRAR